MGFRLPWALGPALAVACAAFQRSAPAQESAVLRFRPQRAGLVRILTWTEGTVTIGEFAPGEVEGTLRDTVSFEISALHSVTERIVGSDENSYVLDRTLDSARGRLRAVGGTWTALPPDRFPTGRARAVVTDRLETLEVGLAGDDTSERSGDQWLLENPGLGIELVLPEGPVVAPSDWSGEVVVRFDPIVDWEQEGGAFADRVDLVGQARFTLQRFEVRGADTLAYVSFSGNFLPVTVSDAPEVAERSAAITGGFAGQLIWSTAWGRFVSGANRLAVFVRSALPGGEEPGIEVGMRFDVVNRFQVRP